MSKQNDSNTFMAEIYRQYERLMYFIAGNYIKDPARREDVVQTALVSLLRHEAVLRSLTDAARASYIATAVRNASINQIRLEKREKARYAPMEDVPDSCQPQSPAAESQYLEQENRQQMIASFHALREEDRQLLLGKYLLDLSDAELAKSFGCKPGSIRMKLTRARRTLLEKMKQGGENND